MREKAKVETLKKFLEGVKCILMGTVGQGTPVRENYGNVYRASYSGYSRPPQ